MIPEKWYIKVTQENRADILKHLNSGWVLTIGAYYYFNFSKCIEAMSWDEKTHNNSRYNSYTELFHQDFVKYIINKEEDTIEEPKTEDYSYLEPFLKLIE